ncbi:MAG TPA: hypothetical protein VND64_31500, partial [Pirellulales bacterium]|nr:hypothetical protein [Pirellulales bacterium]
LGQLHVERAIYMVQLLSAKLDQPSFAWRTRISGFTGWIGNARERRVRSCSSWHPVFPSAGLISTFKFDGKPGDREVLTLADRSHCDRGDV